MSIRIWIFSYTVLVASTLSEAGSPGKHSISPAADSVLFKEADGESVNRQELAVLDPSSELCRWLSGSVKIADNWRSIDELDATEPSELLNSYEEMRGTEELTVDKHRELARWCSQNGLKPQAQAHWTVVTNYYADDIEARGMLGHTWISGEWYSREQLLQADARLKQLVQDLRQWTSPCQKIVKELGSDNVAAQKRALMSLRAIDDPSALAALEIACYEVDESAATPFIETIAKIRTPAACSALTRIAMADPQSKRGDLAITKMKTYPLEFYVPELLGLLSTPIETRVQYDVNYLGELLLRRAMFRTTSKEQQLVEYNRLVRTNEPIVQLVNVSEVVSVRRQSRKLYGGIQQTSKASSNLDITVDERAAAKNAMQDQQELDRKIEQYNHDLELKSKNVYMLLARTTGNSSENKPDAWWAWWRSYNHRSPAALPLSKKTYDQVDKAETKLSQLTYNGAMQCSCLVAGTLIQTNQGLKAIESINVGDIVLAQDVESGELCLKPVVRKTLRPPETIYCIKTEEGDIRATGGHRWWVAGRGWLMSAQLEPDMQLHNAKGTTKVAAVKTEAEPFPTHNLVVDGYHTYFVGPQRVLSFDNVDPIPTLRKVPGYSGGH